MNLEINRMNEFPFPKWAESRQKRGVRSVISISNRSDPVYISCLCTLCYNVLVFIRHDTFNFLGLS